MTPAGVTSIVAGNGQSGNTGDGGRATSASIAMPTGIAVDSIGDVFFTDFINNRIRKVTASTGIVTTIAGNGNAKFSGDNGPATGAGMTPNNIALDGQGNLYVADSLNNRIRKISGGTITTVAGSGM